MTKKEAFVTEIKEILKDKKLSKDAEIYFAALCQGEDAGTASKFTENGAKVLKYMQDNVELYNDMFKAKEVGEGLGLSSKTVSGASRKLVSDGYLEKIGSNPVIYSLTDLGKTVEIDISSTDEEN